MKEEEQRSSAGKLTSGVTDRACKLRVGSTAEDNGKAGREFERVPLTEHSTSPDLHFVERAAGRWPLTPEFDVASTHAVENQRDFLCRSREGRL